MSRSLDRLSPDLQQFLERELRFRPARVTPIRGGDINEAFRLVNEEGAALFLKSNRKAPPFLFEREAEGLRWLAETRALRVPEVRGVSVSKGNEGPGWLLLEWIDSGPRSARYDDALGRGLAALHSFKGDPPRSLPPNYIGTLPQSNRLRATWTEFYAEERLRPLVQRALGRRLAPSRWSARFERLISALPRLFDSEAHLCRLHGDLWSGNVLSGSDGEPYLIDPASYLGDREVDLAMMQLFGGFSSRVYAAYDEVLPRAPGAAERVPLYQLYPLLVHVNLFGGSYVDMVEDALARLP